MGGKKWNGKNLSRIFLQFSCLGVLSRREPEEHEPEEHPLFGILNKREWMARKKHSFLPFPR